MFASLCSWQNKGRRSPGKLNTGRLPQPSALHCRLRACTGAHHCVNKGPGMQPALEYHSRNGCLLHTTVLDMERAVLPTLQAMCTVEQQDEGTTSCCTEQAIWHYETTRNSAEGQRNAEPPFSFRKLD